MELLKDLAEAGPEEQARFFNSFDHVLADMDGVIWISFIPLPGAVEFMNSLKKHGKKIRYVTNNGLMSVETLWNLFKKHRFDTETDDLVTPIVSGIAYLKRKNINKSIFAIGTKEFKDELRKAGLKVYPDPPQEIEETIPAVLSYIHDDEDVEAVFFNYDLNLTYIKMQKMATFLKREDCHFITGPGDKYGPVGPLGPLFINYYNFRALEDISGRKGTSVCKPSKYLAEYIIDRYAISDPKRALFVGDAINSDMGFAESAGFQKLLVLSGITTLQDVQCWKHPEE